MILRRPAVVLLITGLLVTGLYGMATSRGSAQDATGPAGLVPHPAHVHNGTCDNLDPNPLYPLTDVALGVAGTPAAGSLVGPGSALPAEVSTTTIQATLDDLLAQPHAVNVHLSADQIDTYIACGAIGGMRTGNDLVFGLAQQNNSDYAGTAWLHANDDGTTTVSIYLVRNLLSASGIQPPAATPAPEQPPAEQPGEQPAQGGQAATETTITMGKPGELNFDPPEVTIAANTDVKVTLPNQGALPHNFSVEELGISVDVEAGGTGETTINAAPGEYEFICAVPGHKEGGMVGKLIVQ